MEEGRGSQWHTAGTTRWTLWVDWRTSFTRMSLRRVLPADEFDEFQLICRAKLYGGMPNAKPGNDQQAKAGTPA
jgi:hypothetical protein